MKLCTIVKNDQDKFVIGEIQDEVGSRVDFENACKEDGVTVSRCDGNSPRWAAKLVDEFWAKQGDMPGMYLAYAQRTEQGAILIGLIKS